MEADPQAKTRLEQARENVASTLSALLSQHGLSGQSVELYLRAFKAEEELEIWSKNPEKEKWTLIKIYSFCKNSGRLGPKRKEGDLQIPEGVYYINRFNPNSKFHLSLGLNYPNASDRKLGDPQAPGGDIFIHGGCQTVGCIPITDAGIEEVYVLAEWAKNGGQDRIPVHLFPFRFTAAKWNLYEAQYPQFSAFWRQLEAVYHAFETQREIPEVKILPDGTYRSE